MKFINENWHFYGIGDATYKLKIEYWVGHKTYSKLFVITTKRDRVTPFSVSIVDQIGLAITIPKPKEFYFLTDKELAHYVKEQLDIRIKEIQQIQYNLLYV